MHHSWPFYVSICSVKAALIPWSTARIREHGKTPLSKPVSRCSSQFMGYKKPTAESNVHKVYHQPTLMAHIVIAWLIMNELVIVLPTIKDDKNPTATTCTKRSQPGVTNSCKSSINNSRDLRRLIGWGMSISMKAYVWQPQWFPDNKLPRSLREHFRTSKFWNKEWLSKPNQSPFLRGRIVLFKGSSRIYGPTLWKIQLKFPQLKRPALVKLPT